MLERDVVRQCFEGCKEGSRRDVGKGVGKAILEAGGAGMLGGGRARKRGGGGAGILGRAGAGKLPEGHVAVLRSEAAGEQEGGRGGGLQRRVWHGIRQDAFVTWHSPRCVTLSLPRHPTPTTPQLHTSTGSPSYEWPCTLSSTSGAVNSAEPACTRSQTETARW
eukprot:262385-Chlamydomonas_euryale.AAC.2